jgi:uncharacterized protein (TIGR03663 family)
MRWLPFWAAVAVALALRLAALGEMPLHHDEGVNAHLTARTAEGSLFRYNPAELHGPLPIFVGALGVLALGTGDAALRLPVALASTATLLLLLPLRRRLGMAGTATAAWLLAVSPSLVYYGRDFIHETYLVFFTLALVVAGSVWLERRRPAALILAAASLASLFAVKETAVITLAGLAGALLLARFPWRNSLAGASRETLAGAALAFAGVWVLLFTSFLTDPAGVLSPFRALLLWAEKGVEGAGLTRPWTYFPEILLRFETALAAGALLGAGAALRRRDAFGLFCALWTASQLAAYSIIPYKTPWLVLNIVLPAALTAGVFTREVTASPAPALRRGGAVLLALALAATAWRAADVAFRRYDDPGLLLLYAPTDRDVRRLIASVEEVAERTPDGREITIKLLSSHLWPLPWYLRDLGRIVHRPRLDAEPQPDADVLIVTDDQEARVRRRLHGTYARRTFRLRPHQPVVVHVNQNVRGGFGSDPDRGPDGSPREANVSPGKAGLPDQKASLPDRGADRPDRGLSLPDLGLNRSDLGADGPDLGPSRPDLGPGRPYLGANRLSVEASRFSFRREGGPTPPPEPFGRQPPAPRVPQLPGPAPRTPRPMNSVPRWRHRSTAVSSPPAGFAILSSGSPESRRAPGGSADTGRSPTGIPGSAAG